MSRLLYSSSQSEFSILKEKTIDFVLCFERIIVRKIWELFSCLPFFDILTRIFQHQKLDIYNQVLNWQAIKCTKTLVGKFCVRISRVGLLIARKLGKNAICLNFSSVSKFIFLRNIGQDVFVHCLSLKLPLVAVYYSIKGLTFPFKGNVEHQKCQSLLLLLKYLRIETRLFSAFCSIIASIIWRPFFNQTFSN